MTKINLEKQYSHYKNLRITGKIEMDIPVVENGQMTNQFKTIKIKGKDIQLTIDNHVIHFTSVRHEL